MPKAKAKAKDPEEIPAVRPGPVRRPGAARLADRTVDDPDGIEWHGINGARWAAATAAAATAGTAPIDHFEPLPLPAFGASRSVHVTREVLGRFLQERSTGIVHDVYNAKAECNVDAIPDATFFHFWAEVVADAAEDEPCPFCMAG